MANASIPGLPVAITLDGTELMELVQPGDASTGVTKRATTGQIAALAGLYNYALTAESVFGNPTSTTSIGTSIVGAPGQALRYDGAGQIGFGAIDLANATSVTGVLPVSNGGIGTGSLTSGTVLLGNATGAVQTLANVTAGYVLTTNGTSTAPSWQVGGGLANQPPLTVLGVTGNATATPAAIQGGTDQVLRVDHNGTALTFGQVNLSSTAAITGSLSVSAYLTGIVAVPQGGSGTGTLTANGLVAGNGTASVQIIPADTGGKLLLAQGTATLPAFVTATGDVTVSSVGTATIATNAVTYSKLQQVTALSVVGNTSSAVANATAIPGTANQVLIVNPGGTGLAFGQVNLSSTSAITGTLGSSYFTGILSVPFGGTGQTSLTAFGGLFGNGTNAVQAATALIAGQLLVGQTSTSLPIGRSVTGDITLSSSGTATIATAAVSYFKMQNVTALSVVANASSATTVPAAVSGAANQVLVINPGGTALLFGQVNLSSTSAVTGTISLTTLVTGVLPIANGGTNASVAATAIVNLGGMALLTTGQVFTGGLVLPALSLGTAAASTLTLVAGNPSLQAVTINGTAAFVAPSSNCEIDLWVTNAGSASTISFSGYSVGSNTGDTYDTTSGHRFIFQSRTANGSSTYAWKALQ